MRAAFYSRFGTPRDVLQHGDVALPALGPGDVRVRVVAAGVNPVDWKLMAGQRSAVLPHALIVPCTDGAGYIDAVGEGVVPARIGEHVWLHNGAARRAVGTAAQWTVVPGDLAVRLPAGVGSEVGACLGIPALTAYRAVLGDGPIDGQTVLVTGGAGGVGNYAVQLAKLHGARVISTVSSDAKAEAASAAGADCVVDYGADDTVRRILEFTGGDGVDRIVETNLGANLALIVAVLRQRGVVAIYGSAADMMPRIPVTTLLRKEARLHFVGVLGAPEDQRTHAVNALSSLLERGALRHRTVACFPLERAVDAFEAAMSGRLAGKVILAP